MRTKTQKAARKAPKAIAMGLEKVVNRIEHLISSNKDASEIRIYKKDLGIQGKMHWRFYNALKQIIKEGSIGAIIRHGKDSNDIKGIIIRGINAEPSHSVN